MQPLSSAFPAVKSYLEAEQAKRKQLDSQVGWQRPAGRLAPSVTRALNPASSRSRHAAAPPSPARAAADQAAGAQAGPGRRKRKP